MKARPTLDTHPPTPPKKRTLRKAVPPSAMPIFFSSVRDRLYLRAKWDVWYHGGLTSSRHRDANGAKETHHIKDSACQSSSSLRLHDVTNGALCFHYGN